MMSDSKSFEDIETAEDMDLSDDDGSGMESKHSDVSDHRDFYKLPPQRFPQVNLNRPPPSVPLEGDINQQRKSWIHNNLEMEEDKQSSQNFMSPSRGGFAKNNFRGQNRGGRGMNNGNFRGNRRGGRGNFRGNNRGGQW